MIEEDIRFIVNIINHNKKEFVYSFDDKKEADEFCREQMSNRLIYRIYLSEISDIYNGLYDKNEELIKFNCPQFLTT